MAVFNPSVPQTNDPNYLGYSKPISQPEADKSFGVALESAGEVLQSGAKLGEFLVEDHIEKGLYAAIDPVRQQYSDALKNAEAALKGEGQNIVQSQSSGEQPPPALAGLQDQVRTVFNSKGNGRISDTDYKARLDVIAKDFRSRYPGWRPFIDQKIESITGENPANALIKNRLSDINSYLTNAQTERNHIRNQIISNPFPGANQILQGFDTGRLTQYDVVNWLEQNKGLEATIKVLEARNNLIKSDRELKINNAKDAANDIASQIASSSFNNMKTGGGLNIPNTLRGFMEGNIQLNDEHWRLFGMAADSNRLDTVKYIRQRLTQAFGTTLSTGEINSIAEANMYMHDQLSTAIFSKDKGAAFTHLNLGGAIFADGVHGYLQNQDMRTLGQLLHFYQTAGGPNAMQEAFRVVQFSDLPKELQSKFTVDLMRAVAQPDIKKMNENAPADIRKYGETFTMNKLLDENATLKVPDNPEYNAAVSRLTTQMLNPQFNDDGRRGLAAFAFKSIGVLSRFGKNVDDQIPIFNDWTKPEMTAENKRLGPETFNQYKAWTEDAYVKLYRGKLQDLNAFQDIQNVQLVWDPVALRINAIPNRTQRSDRQTDTRDPRVVVQQVQGKLNELNTAFSNMGALAKASGEDPNNYIIKTLFQNGVSMDNIKDPSGQMLKIMMQNSPNHAKYTDETEEDNRNSLARFLANPTLQQMEQKDRSATSTKATPRDSSNLGDIQGIQVDDIPKGMSAQQFIKILKNRKQ